MAVGGHKQKVGTMDSGYGTARQLSEFRPLSAEEELHWLALILVPGIGPRQGKLLLERYHTPLRIFQTTVSELESLGLPGAAARSIAGGCTFEEALAQQARLRELGAQLLPLTHPYYPPLLRSIFDPPLLLMVQGHVELLRTVKVAIVGTRRSTPYGNAVGERLAQELAQRGVTIVSGMARGIDTVAHRGALKAGGATIAVLGHGLDVLYPVENKELKEEISRRGLLVSEFPLGTPAYPQNFPIRNRIISGMSSGVVVVEGARYSGSTITARSAAEQGRQVFAVPGNITSKMSWGPNLLIKQGARVVQSWEDVVNGLPESDRVQLFERCRRDSHSVTGQSGDGSAAETTATLETLLAQLGPLQNLGREILKNLSVDEAIDLDELLQRIGYTSSSELLATLFELEMLGLVRQYPGMRYSLVWRDELESGL